LHFWLPYLNKINNIIFTHKQYSTNNNNSINTTLIIRNIL
jgi:hypothetical protein